MGWGDAIKAAWQNASEAAKAAGTAIADGAKSIAHGTSQAARNGVLSASRSTPADTLVLGTTKVVQGASKAVSAAKAFGSAVANAVGRFTNKPAGKPVAACSIDPVEDKDIDGALMVWNYKTKTCEPLNGAKGPITPETISRAKQQGYQSMAGECPAKRAGQAEPRTIVYVNGIRTDKESHCRTLKAIGDSTCANVIGIYNATQGAAVDVGQTAQDRALINEANKGHAVPDHDGRNPAVDSLSDYVVQEVKAGRSPEIWAHSQGGAVTSLALYEASNSLKATRGGADPLKNVKVTSFGSAAPRWPDGPQYEHYVHVDDATPVLLGLGDASSSDKDRAGTGAKVIRFSGPPGKPPFEAGAAKPSLGPPAFTANHDVEKTYIEMYKQAHKNQP